MPYANPIVRKAYAKKWHKENDNGIQRRRRLRHLLILNRIQLELGCQHCGYDENARALDFHHIDRKTKSFTIGAHISKNIMELLKETEKCIVLCSNCHRIEGARLNPNSVY